MYKQLIENETILDLYQFKYGYPQAVTLNLLTDFPLDRIRSILNKNDEFSKFQKPKKIKKLR